MIVKKAQKHKNWESKDATWYTDKGVYKSTQVEQMWWWWWRGGGSASLAKIMQALDRAYRAYVGLDKFFVHLPKDERGKVCLYQWKKNAITLCWLSPTFNTFIYTAVTTTSLS